MFIWRDDPFGNRIGQALLDAADRGVEVTVTKDLLGAIFELGEESRQSFFHKKYGFLTALKQRVINAYSSKPDLFSWEAQRPNELVVALRQHRNVTIFDDALRNDHSKFIIVDNEVLFVGGMNFEERAVSTDANGLIWQDYLLECHGGAFAENLRDRMSGAARGDSSFEFVLNDPGGMRRFEIKPCVVDLLKNAKETCRIEMAYVGDPDVADSLVDAVDRGVDVHMIVPAWANIQHEYNIKTMREIFQRTGGRISIYLSPDMLHAKMMEVDSQYIFVGSANFNVRALKNFAELNVLITGDVACAETIRREFIVRRERSRKVSKIDDLNYRKIKALCEYIFG
jgi:cardiolipin synthase